MTDLKTLREVAEAVILAERPFAGAQLGSAQQVRKLEMARATFRTTFREAAVLALLDRIEELEGALDALHPEPSTEKEGEHG